MSPVSKAFLATALAFATFAAPSLAQCPRPDRLDCGPCCSFAQAQVPSLPAFKQSTLDICWKDCAVDNTLTCQAVWNKPVQPLAMSGVTSCGVYNTDLRLKNSAGVDMWAGKIRMHYSRTWLETPPGGQLQVWRFLVNGDLLPTTAAGGVPCPVPPCAAAFGGRVRFTGYVDYARNCATGIYQFAWMLSHVCDKVDHAPGFLRAGVFHPDRSYSFVGPSAGFVPGPIQPLEGGGGPFEDVRRLIYPPLGATGPVMCDFEEPIQHSLQPQQQLCNCTTAGSPPPQWLLANLFISGSCGTNVMTPGFPFLPGYLSMGIGSWTIPATFPGQEFLRWNAGGYDYVEGCIGVVRQEVFFGVTTLRGYPANQVLCGGVGPTLPLTFIDQSNSLRSGTTVMNIPYTSDHIINLNH